MASMTEKTCDCDVNVLLQEERRYMKWNDKCSLVFCEKHRVWVWFSWEAKKACKP